MYLVHEGALADVGVAAHEQRAGVGVDGRQARQMLPHLLEVGQRRAGSGGESQREREREREREGKGREGESGIKTTPEA